MANIKKAKLFTITSEIFVEQERLDIRLNSDTVVSLMDGRYVSFNRASGYIKLTTSEKTVNRELALELQTLLNTIVRKVISELELVQKAEIGPVWKK
jgi:hypothetical protein